MSNRPATNRAELYNISRYVTEIYDQTETQREDLVLIKSLIGSRSARLEPFCGHGRLPSLAEAGHSSGIDYRSSCSICKNGLRRFRLK